MIRLKFLELSLLQQLQLQDSKLRITKPLVKVLDHFMEHKMKEPDEQTRFIDIGYREKSESNASVYF